jgi:hypothetical protein
LSSSTGARFPPSGDPGIDIGGFGESVIGSGPQRDGFVKDAEVELQEEPISGFVQAVSAISLLIRGIFFQAKSGSWVRVREGLIIHVCVLIALIANGTQDYHHFGGGV